MGPESATAVRKRSSMHHLSLEAMAGAPSRSLPFRSMNLPNQANKNVPNINHEKCDLSQLRKQDAEFVLRLWDMDPKTSTVRRLIRNKILEHLSKRPLFLGWGMEERRNVAGYVDEKLFAKAESMVHYMNLSTLERRMNDFIDDHRNVGGSTDLLYDVSSPSIGSVGGSCGVLYKREPPSPDNSCITFSNSVGDSTALPSWASVQTMDLVSNPFPLGDLATSNSCLPNRHHDTLVNPSLALDGNIMNCSGTALYAVPSVSTCSTEDRPPTLILSNNYIGSQNSNILGDNRNLSIFQMPRRFSHEPLIGGSAHTTRPMHSGSAHTTSDMPFIPDCNLSSSERLNMPAASFGSSENVHLLGNQGNFMLNSTNSYPHSVEHRHFPHCRQQEDSQLLLRSQSDRLQQKQNHFQQQYLLVENKFSDKPQPPSLVNFSSQVNGCTLEYQLSLESKSKSKSKHVVSHQHWSCLEGSKKRSPACDSSVISEYTASIPSVDTVDREQPPLNCMMMEHPSPRYRSQKERAKHLLPVLDDSHMSHEGHAQECKKIQISTSGSAEVMKHKGLFLSSDTVDHEQPLSKRVKTAHPSLSCLSQNETAEVSVPFADDTHYEKHCQDSQELKSSVNTAENMKTEPFSCFSHERLAEKCEVEVEDPVMDTNMTLNVESSANSESTVTQPEQENMQVSVEAGELEPKDICMTTAPSAVQVTGKKLDMLKKRGISLIDAFTSETIRAHISSLKASVHQTIQNANQKKEMDENTCSLCGMKNLCFESPAKYCASCFKQIKPKGVYYLIGGNGNEHEAQGPLCTKCYNIPGENAKVGERYIPKANLERRKNYAEADVVDEPWVQCDKCSAWHHQICALFNSTRNEVKAGYTCPTCLLQEIENGERESLPRNRVLGAEDLPTTILSDHIEQRLFRRLTEDRQERAKSSGKNFYDVPAAEGLVVRIVSSFVNKVEVKQAFRDIFQEEKYPSEFPYRSKAILLFQKIDGADVCLFGMYVQEYDSGCAYPNKRHVCISYIDSVKYFSPNIAAASGEALRSFVYQEILIGYLEYCKKRGFTDCYIWACPPLKRDDYILYCHPKLQKMPKADKLREWYQTIIRKAQKEELVVDHTNLYDQFFVHSKESKAKITAARLPYFDNDHWPGEAERLLQSGNGSKPQKRGRKAASDRALRAARRDSAIENPKDILLMDQLREIICPMKENFIMIHLQHRCKHCCQTILSGKQWVCTVCKNFQLCEECFSLEQNLEMKDRHRASAPEKHSFHKVEVEEVLADIDGDETMRSEIFDTRFMFLDHCQSSHYQFDTLRRAKHSTMMILYDLHKKAEPAYKPPCGGCHNDIDGTQQSNRVSRTGYDLCDSCYQKEHAGVHEDELIKSAYASDHNLQLSSKNRRVERKDLGSALLHANNCKNPRCSFQSCHLIKRLFLHGKNCPTRLKGGCMSCMKMWALLNQHARNCNESECNVPRCRDMKEIRRRKMLADSKQQIVVDGCHNPESKVRMKEWIKQQTEEIIEGNCKNL